MKLDDVLRSVGEFGLYQKRLYALIVLPAMFHACQTMNYVFLLGHHGHSCKLPSADNENSTNNHSRYYSPDGINTWSVAHNGSTWSMADDISGWTSGDSVSWATECMTYTYFNATNTTSKKQCTEWNYDQTIFIESATSEFNLVCDNKIYKSHASMASFSGGLAATLVMGTLGDIIGRRMVLCISVTVMFLSDLALAWSPNIHIFSAIHFLTGFSGTSYFAVAVITVLELVGPSKRTLAGLVIEMVWSLGMVVLCIVAYFIRNWRYLQIAISTPAFILLFYWLVIPESPRWLLSQGKKKEALEVLRKVAFVNKTRLPDDIGDIECEREFKFKEMVLPLLRNRTLMIRWALLTSAWFVLAMAYYGLSYNIGRIAGDLYVNFLIAALVEFLVYVLCLVLAGRFGRKPVQCGSMIIAGLALLGCIATTLYANESCQCLTTAVWMFGKCGISTAFASQWTTVVLSMVGKCGVSAAFANAFMYTPELFPTYVRSFIAGFCNTGAKIGTLISPYIANIVDFVPDDVGKIIPFVIFGGITVLVGLICLVLPETLHTHLPETIEEAVMLQRKRRHDDVNGHLHSEESIQLKISSC